MNLNQTIKTRMTDVEVSARAHRILEIIEIRSTADSRKLSREQSALQKELAVELGRRIGGKLTSKWLCVRSHTPYGFSAYEQSGIGMGRPFFDHAYVYAVGDGRKQNYAVAAHLYHCDMERMTDFAEKHLLRFSFPPFPSWHYPLSTTLVLWTDATKGDLANKS